MNNDDIRKAYDRLTPDEETKERMLRAIMARSAEMEQEASAKPVIVPWYVRLRVPMGISAAAMACAMVFTLASNNPELVQNGALRQEMLETKPTATTIVTENEVTGAYLTHRGTVYRIIVIRKGIIGYSGTLLLEYGVRKRNCRKE